MKALFLGTISSSGTAAAPPLNSPWSIASGCIIRPSSEDIALSKSFIIVSGTKNLQHLTIGRTLP
jgi:hypothetical protein